MRKYIYAALVWILTFVLIYSLNTKFGAIPPLGKLLDPFNGALQNAENGHSPADIVDLEGLNASVSVVYDSLLIPHIFAENEEDLYFAQGFITATHRLWQMEFQTHFAAGRLSEVFGDNPRILELDRRQRRIGLAYGAANATKKVMENPITKKNLEAYSKGVNAYIQQLTAKNLPLEYKIFDYRPEPWSPYKSTLLLKYMANDLAGKDYDLESTNSRSLLDEEMYRFLFPIREHGTQPVINRVGDWNFSLDSLTSSYNVNPHALAGRLIEQPDPDNGSNNWVVSGDKTYSGNPILAGDPHLGLNLPSIWYAMQLNAPGVNAMGVTLPGALDVIIGFNENIAWTETNSRRDVKDWYKITFTNDAKTHYQYGNQQLPITKKTEVFKIRGAKDFVDTIMYTHYGPIVFDDSYPTESARQNYALRWMAHDESNESLTFHLLNRAKNFEDYREALSHFDCPAQNFAFGSRDGDIALTVQGKFPIKSYGQGQFLLDGADPKNEWKGYIPFEQNAYEKNPARGFVSSANQFPVDSTYPYFAYDGNYEHYRNRRIIDQLSNMDNITINDMVTLQNDVFNLKAAESLPFMLSKMRSEMLTEIQEAYLNTLKSWDYENEPDLLAPVIYKIWWEEFNKFLWDEFINDSIQYRFPSTPNTIYIMKNYEDFEFVDNKETSVIETMEDLIMSSFISAAETLNYWKSINEKELNWSNYRNVSVNHLIPQMAAFSVKGIHIGGGRNIVNATKERHGPSWKMIVELGTSVKAWGVYPGGQSGNPGSPYYSNFIDTWSNGKHFQLLFMRDQNHEDPAIKHVQKLSN